jgi:nuclear pore complex protein Nup62
MVFVLMSHVLANSTATLIDHIYFISSVSSASSGTSSSINFCQLEESINKWNIDLDEQEKVFMNQATQVNAWDRLLIGNGEKVNPCQPKCKFNL